MKKTFLFEVWEPVGVITVEGAETVADAEEKVSEYGYDSKSDGISFEADSDGQEWELKLKKD